MSIAELKNWFVFIQEAPENVRSYLAALFWLLVALLLVWAILKIVFNKQFKELYSVLGVSAKLAGQVGKVVVKSAAKSLELPEPYPRVARFVAILFMLNSYATSIVFVVLMLFTAVLSVLSNTPSLWVRTGGLLVALVAAFFARFFFADGEQDRVRLFRRSGSTDGS